MPSLIGNKPNQVPTNGDLGSMAYRSQDDFVKKSGDTINGVLTVASGGAHVMAASDGATGTSMFHFTDQNTYIDNLKGGDHVFRGASNTDRARINATGIDLNGTTVRVRTSRTPASASAAGNAGEICWDSSYLYVCVATNTWKRVAINSW